MDICMSMAESFCCLPETITTLLISYTPMLNKMLKKKRNSWNDRIILATIYYVILFFLNSSCSKIGRTNPHSANSL